MKLDCKTRWNSLVEMVERFVEMQETIQKSVPHLKDDKITFSESEFDKLCLILKCLKTIQIAATSICSRDSTLLAADCAFSFCLKTIRKEDTEFAQRLYQAVLNRIIERRTESSGILQKLHYPEDNKDLYEEFVLPNKRQVIDFSTFWRLETKLLQTLLLNTTSKIDPRMTKRWQNHLQIYKPCLWK